MTDLEIDEMRRGATGRAPKPKPPAGDSFRVADRDFVKGEEITFERPSGERVTGIVQAAHGSERVKVKVGNVINLAPVARIVDAPESIGPSTQLDDISVAQDTNLRTKTTSRLQNPQNLQNQQFDASARQGTPSGVTTSDQELSQAITSDQPPVQTGGNFAEPDFLQNPAKFSDSTQMQEFPSAQVDDVSTRIDNTLANSGIDNATRDQVGQALWRWNRPGNGSTSRRTAYRAFGPR
jgi:hypothetical protein